MLALNKIFYESFFCGTLRLRYFIFMMRKKQIDASGMDIKALSQIFHTHRGALNMPPRAPFAPRRWPCRFAAPACNAMPARIATRSVAGGRSIAGRFFCFPQNKIFRTSFFVFVGIGSAEVRSAFGEIRLPKP